MAKFVLLDGVAQHGGVMYAKGEVVVSGGDLAAAFPLKWGHAPDHMPLTVKAKPAAAAIRSPAVEEVSTLVPTPVETKPAAKKAKAAEPEGEGEEEVETGGEAESEEGDGAGEMDDVVLPTGSDVTDDYLMAEGKGAKVYRENTDAGIRFHVFVNGLLAHDAASKSAVKAFLKTLE